MKLFSRHKKLIATIMGLSGLLCGAAVGSYNLVVEKTKVIQRVDEHEKQLISILGLIQEDRASTKEDIKKITEDIHKIQVDVAVLRSTLPQE